MYLRKRKKNLMRINFIDYAISIKETLLNQIIYENCRNREYFEKQYDELFRKYADTISASNYNKICSKFVHDVYELIPVNET